MTALNELKILIDCDNYQWKYKLDKSDVQLESYKRFRTRNANIYALVEINHLLSMSEPSSGAKETHLPTSASTRATICATSPKRAKLATRLNKVALATHLNDAKFKVNLPRSLRDYTDVFATSNAKRLPPY
jgi:hypothetical protein